MRHIKNFNPNHNDTTGTTRTRKITTLVAFYIGYTFAIDSRLFIEKGFVVTVVPVAVVVYFEFF